MSNKVFFFHLRRSGKSKNPGLHPFGTIGVVYNSKTKSVHVSAAILHSSDPHFVKKEAKKRIIHNCWNNVKFFCMIGHELPRIEAIVPPSVFNRISDPKKAQKALDGIIADAIKEKERNEMIARNDARTEDILKEGLTQEEMVREIEKNNELIDQLTMKECAP